MSAQSCSVQDIAALGITVCGAATGSCQEAEAPGGEGGGRGGDGGEKGQRRIQRNRVEMDMHESRGEGEDITT